MVRTFRIGWMWLLFAVEGLVSAVGAGFLDASGLVAFSSVLIGINSVVYVFFLLRDPRNDRTWLTILLISYAALLSFLVLEMAGFTVFGGADAVGFHNAAVNTVNGLPVAQSNIYDTVVLAGFYRIFGIQQHLAQYLSVLCNLTAVEVVRRTLERLQIDGKIQKICAGALALHPVFLMHSVVLLREPMIVLFVALSLNLFVRWWQGEGFLFWAAAVAVALPAVIFHSGVIAVPIGYAVGLLLFGNVQRKFAVSPAFTLLCGAGLCVLIVVTSPIADMIPGMGLLTRYFGKLSDATSFAERIVMMEAHSGNSTYYIPGAQSQSWGQFFAATPLRMLYFAGSPMPWDWRGLRDVASFLMDSAFYLAAGVISFQGLLQKHPKRTLLVVLILTVLGGFFIYAWGVSNAGAAMRHRTKFIPLIVTAAALALQTQKSKKEHSL